MTNEIVFTWTDLDKVNPHQTHTLHLSFIPRIGETVDLGYIPGHGNISKKVVDVQYILNSDYIIIELA